MPDIKIPNIDFEKAATEFNKALKDGAYVAVGLGVLGFQRAQVQRVELAKQIEVQLSKLPSDLSSQIETQLTGAREQLVELAKTIEAALPEALSAERIEAQVQTFRSQLADLAKTVDERVAPARRQLDEQFDRLEEALPEQAREVVKSVRSAANSQEQTIRNAVGLS